MTLFQRFSTCGSLFFSCCHFAGAALTAYEGFDFTSGTALQNQAGSGIGIGTIPAHPATDFRFNTTPAGLGYNDGTLQLVTTGRAASIDAVTSGTQDLNLPLVSTISSGDLYFSYLVEVEAVSSFGLEWGLLSAVGEAGANAQVGVRSVSNGNFANEAVGIDDRTGPTVVVGNTYFVVGRVTGLGGAAGTGTMTTWFNPTDLSDVPGSAANEIASTGGTFANPITHIWMGLGGEEDAIFDELRLGTTLADVTPFTPIPEPSSTALIFIGAALAAGGRRRRVMS